MRRRVPRGHRVRARDGRALALGLLVVLFAWAPAPEAGEEKEPANEGDGWVTVAPADERFEVRMPSEPEKSVRETSSFLGQIEDVGYKAHRGDEAFLVNRVDLPSVATFFMTDSFLLGNIRDSYLERGNGTQTSYADVKIDGHDGKRLEFVMNQEIQKDARAIFFLVDGQLLSFTGIVPHGQPAPDVERFLGSVKVRAAD